MNPYRLFPLGVVVDANTVLSEVWLTIDSPLAYVLVSQSGRELAQLRFDWQKAAFIDPSPTNLINPSPENLARVGDAVAGVVARLVAREQQAARAAPTLS